MLEYIDDYNEVGRNLFIGVCPVDGTDSKFKWIVDLYGRVNYVVRENQVRIVAPFEDSYNVPELCFIEGLADLVNQLRTSGPVLVHCLAGLNRSGLVCAFSLMKHENLSASKVKTRLREIRSSGVLHNSAFEKMIDQYDMRRKLAIN